MRSQSTKSAQACQYAASPLLRQYQWWLDLRQAAIKRGNKLLQVIYQNRMERIYDRIKRRQESQAWHGEIEKGV